MSKTIPNDVKRLAELLFCEEPLFVGAVDGLDVYAENKSDEEVSEPTGLPVVILWDGRKASSVGGVKALDVLSRL